MYSVSCIKTLYNIQYTILLLTTCYLLPVACNAQQHKIDSLTKLIKPVVEDTNQAKIYLKLSSAYSNVNYDKAIEVLIKAYNLNKKLNYHRGLVNCTNWFGVLNAKKGNYKDALIYFNESVELSKKYFPKENIGFMLNNIGIVYRHIGNYSKAIEYFLNAIKDHTQYKDTAGLCSAYNNLGNTLNSMERCRDALRYHFMSLKIRLHKHDAGGIRSSYGNIGSTYDNMSMPDSALHYFKKALSLYANQDDKENLARLYNQMGDAFNNSDKPDSATAYLQNANTLFTKLGDSKGLVLSNQSLGKVYLKLPNYPKAESYFLQSLAFAQTSKQEDDEKDINFLLARVYNAEKKYDKAIQYFLAYDSLNRNLSEINNAQRIADLQTNFEVEKKEIEIKKLEQEQTIQKLAIDKQQGEINRQRLGLILSGLSGLLALGFVYVLYKSNKQRKKDNKQLVEQKEIIEQKNKEVTDSINYARRIQQAVLTGEDVWNKISKDNFILFKPKDIVSGDFYWAYVSPNGRCIWAAADCTGHGVPGGFMSMLGNSFLNEIVIENRIHKADEILNRLRDKVIQALEQKGMTEQKDGMDIALCVWNKVDNTLEFAGANNAACIVRNKELIELKPDKMPIGSYITDSQKFSLTQYKLQTNDVIYLSSDGYPDQFGGKNGKKFKYRQMEELLTTNSQKPMAEQKEILDNAFTQWKGELEQIDDVLLIGIRV